MCSPYATTGLLVLGDLFSYEDPPGIFWLYFLYQISFVSLNLEFSDNDEDVEQEILSDYQGKAINPITGW
jgi:hypothetical protein